MPKSTNQKIYDKVLIHSNNIARYDEHAQKEVVKILKKVEKQLVADITIADPTGPRYKIYQQKRLKALLKQARKTIATGKKDITEYMGAETEELTLAEGKWSKDLLVPAEVISGTPTVAVPDALLKEIARDTKLDKTPMNTWWNRALLKGNVENSFYENFRAQMRAGVYNGESVPNLIKRVRAITPITRANAEALARTSVQSTVNKARASVFEANAHLLSGLRWISTLDKRTTIICIVRNNKMYTATSPHKPIGHSYEWGAGPGAIHFQCRSCSVPELREGGSVEENDDYESWFKKQDLKTQEKVLGKTRTALYNSGKVKSFDDLVNPKGRPLPLSELSSVKAKRALGTKPPTPAKFVPAKTIEEANKYAKSIGIENNKSKLELNALNIVNKRVGELKDDWNNSLIAYGNVKDAKSYAAANISNMKFNSRYFNNDELLTASLKIDVLSGYHPKGGGTMKAVIDHEFAHVLTYLDMIEKKGVYKEIKSIKTKYSRALTKLRKKFDITYDSGGQVYFQDATLDNSIRNKLEKEYLAEKDKIFVSRYSNKSLSEFTAECFSMALNTPNPSPYALDVYRVLEREFKK